MISQANTSKKFWIKTWEICFNTTEFPRIVSAETILFWKWKKWKFSYSFRIMAIFYFINWTVAAETIEGGKLFKGGNYSREETIQGNTVFAFKSSQENWSNLKLGIESQQKVE